MTQKKVEDQHVWLLAFDHLHRFTLTTSQTTHLASPRALQDRSDAGAGEIMILRDDDTAGARWRYATVIALQNR